ncbi:MAG: Hpt domain-containing protein [Bacteroidota bacterium]
MDTPVLDLSYLTSISGNDSKYMYEVINLFLSTVPDGLKKLEQLVKNTDDFEGIHRQAHSLKSSFSIIKVGDIFDDIAAIVILGREARGKEEIDQRLDNVLATFEAAMPVITAERDRHKARK